MNIQQLEYVLAVDQHRHFARAADACHVTQPTLSQMIQKLEEELNVKIFDRSRQPVCPTETGELLIEQARNILHERLVFYEIANEANNYIGGELKIGVIPTIAPYLLPLFIQSFNDAHPEVHLKISEMITEQILRKLDTGELDVGIMVPPENDKTIKEIPLYTEEFVVYSPRKFNKEFLLAEDLEINEILLLEEGHCFRSQILQFCELRKKSDLKIEYTSGSLETLRYLADKQLGITILPELALMHLSKEQLSKVKHFASPKPVRKISLVIKRDFVKRRLIEALGEKIIASMPNQMIPKNEIIIPFVP